MLMLVCAIVILFAAICCPNMLKSVVLRVFVLCVCSCAVRYSNAFRVCLFIVVHVLNVNWRVCYTYFALLGYCVYLSCVYLCLCSACVV